MSRLIEGDSESMLNSVKAPDALKAGLAAWAIQAAARDSAEAPDSVRPEVKAPDALKAGLAAWAIQAAARDSAEAPDSAKPEVETLVTTQRRDERPNSRRASSKKPILIVASAFVAAASLIVFLTRYPSREPLPCVDVPASRSDTTSRKDTTGQEAALRESRLHTSEELVAQVQQLQSLVENLEQQVQRMKSEARSRNAVVRVPLASPKDKSECHKDPPKPVAILPPTQAIALEIEISSPKKDNANNTPARTEEPQPAPVTDESKTKENGLRMEMMSQLTVAPVPTAYQIATAPLSASSVEQEDR